MAPKCFDVFFFRSLKLKKILTECCKAHYQYGWPCFIQIAEQLLSNTPRIEHFVGFVNFCSPHGNASMEYRLSVWMTKSDYQRVVRKKKRLPAAANVEYITFYGWEWLGMVQVDWNIPGPVEPANSTMSYWNHSDTIGSSHLCKIGTELCYCWGLYPDTCVHIFSAIVANLLCLGRRHMVHQLCSCRTNGNRGNVRSIWRHMCCQMNQIHLSNEAGCRKQRQTPRCISEKVEKERTKEKTFSSNGMAKRVS